MRVLITNNTLRTRGGTESLVRDLARGLNALGHSAIAYTSDPGQQPRLLENDVVPVATDLENLPFKPDIIHGQHHLDAMSAITALPGVPAIYHVHGAVWRGTPVKHPRILHYLAMSHTTKERMMIEAALPDEAVSVFLNPIDLSRFRHVRRPEARARRALFYNRHLKADSDVVLAVRDAGQSSGIEIDFIGYHFGSSVEAPQDVLPRYDIVFASGLSAIEASACGCAVIVLGRTSCGGMLLPENYEQLRGANFSIASNSPPSVAETIAVELQRFSPSAVAEVTARIRRDADMNTAVKKLEALYQRIIARHASAVPDANAESRATSHYLRKITSLIKMTDDHLQKGWSDEDRSTSVEELSARLAMLDHRLKALESKCSM